MGYRRKLKKQNGLEETFIGLSWGSFVIVLERIKSHMKLNFGGASLMDFISLIS